MASFQPQPANPLYPPKGGLFPSCVKFNPLDNNEILVGCSDKRVRFSSFYSSLILMERFFNTTFARIRSRRSTTAISNRSRPLPLFPTLASSQHQTTRKYTSGITESVWRPHMLLILQCTPFRRRPFLLTENGCSVSRWTTLFILIPRKTSSVRIIGRSSKFVLSFQTNFLISRAIILLDMPANRICLSMASGLSAEVQGVNLFSGIGRQREFSRA